MIIQANQDIDRFNRIISADTFLAKKMKCEYNSRNDAAKNNFYVLNDCAISVIGENVSICGQYTDDDLDSILSFCRFLGIYGLESEKDDLPVPHRHVMNYMRHWGECKKSNLPVVKDENLYSFSKFCSNNFVGTDFNTVYSYFARKVNRGFSHAYFIEENGKITTGALSTDYGDEYYITFVSTAKPFRKRGLASELVGHIVAENSAKGTILMCENELVGFYEKLGFVKEREIYLYTLREEQI